MPASGPTAPLGSHRPLTGLRVVELASVLAGPLVGTFLAELGADVTKVEHPERGDVTRNWRSVGESPDGPSAYFAAANGPKQSVRIDLKSREGQQQFDRLLSSADILLQNTMPASLAGLGLNPEALAERFPSLIHIHLQGFMDAPERGGYDMVVQAESGFAALNAAPGGSASRMPVALMDVLAAHQMRSAVLLALYEREKDGKGAYIETWLDASGISALANRATEHLVAGQEPQPLGTLHPQIAPYGETFTCRCGGQVVLAVGNDGQFAALCDILGLSPLASDARFATNPDRVVHRKALAQKLAKPIGEQDADGLLKSASTRGVPLGRVNRISDALNSPTGRAMTASFQWEDTPVQHVRQVAFRVHRTGSLNT